MFRTNISLNTFCMVQNIDGWHQHITFRTINFSQMPFKISTGCVRIITIQYQGLSHKLSCLYNRTRYYWRKLCHRMVRSFHMNSYEFSHGLNSLNPKCISCTLNAYLKKQVSSITCACSSFILFVTHHLLRVLPKTDELMFMTNHVTEALSKTAVR